MNIRKSTKYKEGIVRDVTDKYYQNAKNIKMKKQMNTISISFPVDIIAFLYFIAYLPL